MFFIRKEESEEKTLFQYGTSLVVHELYKSYSKQQIIENLNFSVNAGETLSIIGPSGCGKSTLLYLLAGLDSSNKGRIQYYASNNKNEDENNLQQNLLFLQKYQRNPRISYVMQDYGLFPWKTAKENLALPLVLNKFPLSQQKRLIFEMFKELGLEGVERKYPSELSGGQRQRLALGRALINMPEILLLDEPLSSVDAITREHLQKLIFNLWEKYKFTLILVTHSVSEAMYLGKNIMVMKKISQDMHKANTIPYVEIKNPCFGTENLQESVGFSNLYKTLSNHLANAY